MKALIKSLVLFCAVIYSPACLGTTYTWNGASSVWDLNSNWLPSTGFPGSADNVIIVNAAVQPVLNATQSVTDFTISSGTLDLNTFTLTVTGVATYTLGTINNGTITSTGTSTTFSGTVFGAVVNATSASVRLNGSTFNNIATITQNGGADVLSSGGNTFNAVTTITNNGGGFFALGNNAPDIFATNVNFNNTGTDELYVAYNSTGNQFNGVTTFTNAASARFIYSNAGIGGTAAYNGNVVVSNASPSGGIFFGIVGGTATLADTKTITAGSFATGRLLLRDFTQTGTTAQTLTLTGTALIETGPSAVFNGNTTITSPQVLLNGTRFNGTAAITKNGITQNNSNGGNVFVGAATISNTGAGVLLLGNSDFDTFNDLAISNTGTSQIFLATNATGHLFNGHITFHQTTGTGIFFGSGTGTSTLAATKTLSTAPGVTGGTLNFARFTQTGATAQALTISGATGLLQMGPSVVFDGDVTFVSSQVLLNGCTFNRTAAITKNGGTDNVGVGGNIFNGVTTLTCSGGGNFELGDTAPEVFNSDLTVNNTAGGRFQIGINSAGNLFNGTTIINHGGSTTGLNTVIARNTSSTATFNGNVTLNCSNTVAGSGLIVGNDGTVTIKGNVTVRSTNGRGILFNSAGGGSVTLADGFSITAGTFTTGTLSFNRFTQAGTTTPQNITLTGTADITFSGNSTFNSVATFVAPQLFLNGGRFNNTTSLTKSGATTNAGTGGNIFNGSTTITSSGAGALRLANAAADDFNADVTFVSSGAGGLDPVYARATTFAGNVTVNSAAPIVVGTNGGTPTFDAGNAQTINKTGAANPTFTRMTIAKSANDVTLNTEISISTLLTFTTRYIISSSTNPVTFLDNATVAGVSNASFVSGPVRKTGNDGFIFPVGKSGFYRPIEMSMPASLTDQFTGEYFLTDPNPSFSVGSKDASINHLSRCEYWRLDRTTGSSGVSVTLSWNTTSCGVTTLPDLLVAAWDGTTWRDQGNNTATTGNTTSGTVTSLAPVSIFGPFTLGSTTTSNPLPLELISFNAKLNGNSVDLNWSTLSEKNNDYFVVERTIKGEMFETVDTVKGAGNSASTLRYASKDDYPIAGNSYYRLKQVDFDGSHTYSKLVPINFTKDGNLNFTLYPNPSSEKTSLIFRDIPEGTQEILVVVYSMSGNTLFSSVVKVGGISSDTFVLDAVSKLGSGMYIVSVACGKSIYHQKLMIN